MRNHRAPVLIVCALLIAACQPANQGVTQTQAAESALNTAVAAAQTQAAPPLPTRTPAPTATAAPTIEPSATEPIATESVDNLHQKAWLFKNYLQTAIGGFHPQESAPYDAAVTGVNYLYSDDGAAIMYVDIRKSDETNEAAVEGAALNAFTAIYAGDSDARLEVVTLPRQLRRFGVFIYDSAGNLRFRLSGQWEDVIAYGTGSLSKETFLNRLNFESVSE